MFTRIEKIIHTRRSTSRRIAIAFERYYYSQPLPEGGRDNNTFEDFFGTIESKWTPLAERLGAGSDATNNFTSADFEALFMFLGLMRVRVYVPGPTGVFVGSECVFGPRPTKPKWRDC